MSTTRAGTQASSRPHHRRRHTHAFPPQEYTDFSHTDLSLLAPILLSEKRREKRPAYEKRIKKRISELPAHLQCKHSLLSSFCSMHGKLLPAPVISLFNAMRQEIEDEIARVWVPLAERHQLSSQKREMVNIVQNLAVLWLGAKVFKARFDREPPRALTVEKPSKCAACTLVRMSSSFSTQVAMAALFIGRVHQRVWEGSNRIHWFLEWATAKLPPVKRGTAAPLIWEIGKKFRMTRLGAAEGRRSRKKGKAESIEDDESELGPGTAIYAFSLDQELKEEKTKGPRKLIGDKAQEESENGNYFDETGASNRSRARSSSIYSRTTSGERPPSISIDQNVEDVVALYQQSLEEVELEEGDEEGYPVLSPYGNPNDEFGLSPSRIQSMFGLEKPLEPRHR